MANHTGNLQPTPVDGTKPHGNLQAPIGTVKKTEASCDDGAGGMVVCYPIESTLNPDKSNGEAARAGMVAKYVPAEVAARDLAWWPTSPAPRAATQDEADAFFSSRRNGNQQDERSEADFAKGDEALVVHES